MKNKSSITFIRFSFISRVESIMHKASLAELMGCTMSLCLIGYYTIMVGQRL